MRATSGPRKKRLLQTAETLSPFLESTEPGVVTVELPAERFFGEGDFREKIVVPLQALGLECAWAWRPHPIWRCWPPALPLR